MSVLIKGMEMPKTCSDCEWSYYVGNGRAMCRRVSKTDKTDIMTKRRADFCPLTEIHTPHGKLIDKAKLKRELFVNFMGERIPFYDCDNFPTTLTYIDLHSILSEQPTVIEAEE